MSASLAETLALLKGAKNKYARGGGKTIKLKEGKTRVRILQGEAKFWRDLGVHWIKDFDGKVKIAVGCYDHTYDKPCPIDTAIEAAAKAATSDDELKIIKDWKARKEVLVNALILDGPDASPDPQILTLTPTTFGNFLSIMEEYADEVGNVLDPETGIDFIFERRGKGLDTEYTVMPAPKSKPVNKEVLKKLNDLDAFIEKEYFAGRETKALNHISELAGVKVSLPAPRKAGMLTGPSASVAEEVEEVVEPRARVSAPKTIEVEVEPEVKPAAKAAAPAADSFGADISDDELNDVLADLDDIG